MKRIVFLLMAHVTLATGCERAGAVLDPPIAELAELQGLALRGDTAGIALRDVRCALGAPGCERLFEMTGDACLLLAQEALAAGRAAEAGLRASCARDRYTTLLGAGGGESLSSRALEARRLVREAATSVSAGAEANAALARSAEAHWSAFPASGAGGYYLAASLVWPVAFGRAGEPCPDLARAAALAGAAARAPQGVAPVDTRAAAAEIARRAATMAHERGCTE